MLSNIRILFIVLWRQLRYNFLNDCINGWIQIGIASTLEEAKTLMLNNTTCAKEGAILFYSDHSNDSSWGVRCGTSEMIVMTDCTDNSGLIWEEHQLSMKSTLSGKYQNSVPIM